MPQKPQEQQEPELKYRGVWRATETYNPGSYVSHQGGLWHSRITSTGARPNESPIAWTLAVKRGEAGKMEKDFNARKK